MISALIFAFTFLPKESFPSLSVNDISANSSLSPGLPVRVAIARIIRSPDDRAPARPQTRRPLGAARPGGGAETGRDPACLAGRGQYPRADPSRLLERH